MPVPRTLFLKYPYGVPFGEPQQADQQMTILRDGLITLMTAKEFGTVIESPYQWKRTSFGSVDLSGLINL